ncbi:redoxin family protein [Alphaproteobacteria bacterium]|jgi:peroxiredoxin|nr:redoxin family protein [Alphaproteobacteria bacterium]
MTIEVGQRIPSVNFQIKTEDGIDEHSSDDYFGKGRTILFALPGAFTPTCSARHLPTYLEKNDELRAAGVDRIACLAVNDAHVMKAWGDANGVEGKIDMLADPHLALTRALGLDRDMGGILGVRASRSAMIIDDGVVSKVFEEEVGAFEVSGATHVLGEL